MKISNTAPLFNNSHQQVEKIPMAMIGLDHLMTRELLHTLLAHPHFQFETLQGFINESQKLSHFFPALTQHHNLFYNPVDKKQIAQHNKIVILNTNDAKRVEVLSKFFRKSGIKTINLFPHLNPESAPYGLCEIFGEDIKKAYQLQLPNPAATPIILALAPFLQNQTIAPHNIIADIKSSPKFFKPDLNFLDLKDNVLSFPDGPKTYAKEITTVLNQLSKETVNIQLHHSLIPIHNGIHVTLFTKPFKKNSLKNLRTLFEKFYQHYPFVNLFPEGKLPNFKTTSYTNQCQIGMTYDDVSEHLILTAVIDENGKGSVGNILQCLECMSA